MLEIDDAAGFAGARGDLRGSRSDSDLGIEDGGLLRVFHEDAQFTGLAGLCKQLNCSDKQDERDVTSRMS